MSQNKLPPKEMARYVVVGKEKLMKGIGKYGYRETVKYFSTQREARVGAKDMLGDLKLFKISYDFIERL